MINYGKKYNGRKFTDVALEDSKNKFNYFKWIDLLDNKYNNKDLRDFKHVINTFKRINKYEW